MDNDNTECEHNVEDPIEEHYEGTLPFGGVRSEIIYLDEDEIVPKSKATKAGVRIINDRGENVYEAILVIS
jgi:hypothetical protein